MMDQGNPSSPTLIIYLQAETLRFTAHFCLCVPRIGRALQSGADKSQSVGGYLVGACLVGVCWVVFFRSLYLP